MHCVKQNLYLWHTTASNSRGCVASSMLLLLLPLLLLLLLLQSAACVHTCTHMQACASVHAHAHAHICIHAHVHGCAYVHLCMRVHTRTNACIYLMQDPVPAVATLMSGAAGGGEGAALAQRLGAAIPTSRTFNMSLSVLLLSGILKTPVVQPLKLDLCALYIFWMTHHGCARSHHAPLFAWPS